MGVIGFDGTRYKSERERIEKEREILLRLYSKDKKCPWTCNLCDKQLKDMEKCFKVPLTNEVKERVVFT